MPTEPAAASLAAIAFSARPTCERSMLSPTENAQQHDEPHEIEIDPVVAHGPAEDREFRQAGDADRAAGHVLGLHRREDEHELQRERGHRQVEPAQLQDGTPDEIGRRHRDRHRDEHGDEGVPAQAQHHEHAAIGADHAERRLAERELVAQSP